MATVVEYIEKPNEDGYILELFDAEGNTLAVVPVLATDISKPYPKAVVNYRRLAERV